MAFDPAAECWVNLAGSYDYLELPYYVSQDYENEQKPVRPTCKEMLDAYVTPLFLEKAKLNSLPVPEYYISNGYFEPPVVVDPINPFMTKARTVLSPGRQESTAKSMTRNYTYAICCQDIPAGAKVQNFRAVMGWTASRKYLAIAEAIWDIFHVPLAKVRVIVLADGRILYSDVSQLPLDSLTERERLYLEKRVQWEK